MTTKKVKLSMLVEDFDIYPRTKVDTTHAGHIADAIAAGFAVPLILVEEKTNRIVDGWHRKRAYERLLGEDGEVEAQFKRYRNQAELLDDAVRLNSTHGRALTPFDRRRCILLAQQYGLSMDALADALNTQADSLKTLVQRREGRMAKFMTKSPTGESIEEPTPLKYTVRHLVGQRLSAEQFAANEKLGGQNPTYYANQLITLLETPAFIDTSNDNLMHALAKLRDLLDVVLRDKAA